MLCVCVCFFQLYPYTCTSNYKLICYKLIFPSIIQLPITTTTAERTFSTMNMVKIPKYITQVINGRMVEQ